MLKLIVAMYVAATSLALVVIKLGSKAGAPAQFIDGHLHFNITPYTILGVFLYGVSFLLYLFLISKYDLGYIVPLTTALVFTVIFIASYFIFHEAFTASKLLAIVLILVGLFLLNAKK